MFNQCDYCRRKTMNMKAFMWAALNANWAWTSKMTEQISAFWIIQAMLCVFKIVFLAGKHEFYIQAKVIYKCLVVETKFTYWKIS